MNLLHLHRLEMNKLHNFEQHFFDYATLTVEIIICTYIVLWLTLICIKKLISLWKDKE